MFVWLIRKMLVGDRLSWWLKSLNNVLGLMLFVHCWYDIDLVLIHWLHLLLLVLYTLLSSSWVDVLLTVKVLNDLVHVLDLLRVKSECVWIASMDLFELAGATDFSSLKSCLYWVTSVVFILTHWLRNLLCVKLQAKLLSVCCKDWWHTSPAHPHLFLLLVI